MTGLHWDLIKLAKLAFVSHEPIAVLMLAWMISVPLYIILQTWLVYAWTGRWRITALIPLIVLALVLIVLAVGPSYDPDQFGPPPENWDRLYLPPILAVWLFSPLGLMYLAIAGIAGLVVRRSPAT